MDSTKSTDRRLPGGAGGRWTGAAAETSNVEAEKPANAYSKIRRNAASLFKDAVRLLDLQLQLFAVDAGEFWKQARLAMMGTITAIVILLAAITVLLFGLAETLETAAGFAPQVAKSIVALGALLFGGLILSISLRSLTEAGGTLSRSYGELQENLNWLRSVVSQDDD
ncbi:MAG TPA: phage holin family protein [Planctomicrobium sp.]|nr:phage holin family protein [Planctomicrobium sp.]